MAAVKRSHCPLRLLCRLVLNEDLPEVPVVVNEAPNAGALAPARAWDGERAHGAQLLALAAHVLEKILVQLIVMQVLGTRVHHAPQHHPSRLRLPRCSATTASAAS